MKLVYAYTTVILTFILFSCSSDTSKVEIQSGGEGVFNALITHSAGDRWSTSDRYLPLPMNVASVNNKLVLILSDRLKKNEKVYVKPIGSVNLMENDSLRTYVLAIPQNKSKVVINAEGFDEFSTVHSSAKWIVEQYLLNRKGGHSTKLKSWENEKSAINYLLN